MLIGALARRFEGGCARRPAAGPTEKLRRDVAAGASGRNRVTGNELAARLRLTMRGANDMPSLTPA